MTDRRQFRRWCDWLRRTFPLRLDAPVSIRLVSPEKMPPNTDGYSWHHKESKERYVSFIRNDLDDEKAIEALIHEYAHLSAWQLAGNFGVYQDDCEFHALLMQKINKRWYAWMKQRGV
jgi:hypothetical protein